jgi:hypothetical protein
MFGKYVIIYLVLGVLGRKKQVKDVSVFCLAGGWALRMTMINSLISFARTVSWMQGQTAPYVLSDSIPFNIKCTPTHKYVSFFQDYST